MYKSKFKSKFKSHPPLRRQHNPTHSLNQSYKIDDLAVQASLAILSLPSPLTVELGFGHRNSVNGSSGSSLVATKMPSSLYPLRPRKLFSDVRRDARCFITGGGPVDRCVLLFCGWGRGPAPGVCGAMVDVEALECACGVIWDWDCERPFDCARKVRKETGRGGFAEGGSGGSLGR